MSGGQVSGNDDIAKELGLTEADRMTLFTKSLTKYLLLVVLVSFCSCTAESVDSASLMGAGEEELNLGKTYKIEAKNVPGEWQLQIALPEGYDETSDNYPVVYVLDGHFYFSFITGRLQRFMERGDMPKSILVGIPRHVYRDVFFYFGSQKADRFLDFMDQEVFPFVENKFRTHKDRSLMGWHNTGGFVFHTLMKRPELFDNYIAASPNNFDPESISFDALSKQSDLQRKLYFGALDKEYGMTYTAQELDSILKKSAPENLDWKFHMAAADFEGEFISVYRLWGPGMKAVYKDYAAKLNFDNVSDFRAFGGLDYVKKHYEQRALKYGGSAQVPNGIIGRLVGFAMRADDIALFDELMNSQVFYLNFNINGVHRYANFYVKHDEPEKALSVYENVLDHFTELIVVHSSMATIYEQMDDIAKARKSYEKAIDLAKEQSDESLAELEQKLVELN